MMMERLGLMCHKNEPEIIPKILKLIQNKIMIIGYF